MPAAHAATPPEVKAVDPAPVQAAELEVREGKLICDRNKAFRIRLTPPQEPEPAGKGERQ